MSGGRRSPNTQINFKEGRLHAVFSAGCPAERINNNGARLEEELLGCSYRTARLEWRILNFIMRCQVRTSWLARPNAFCVELRCVLPRYLCCLLPAVWWQVNAYAPRPLDSKMWTSSGLPLFLAALQKKYILNIYIFLHTEELLRTITTEAIQSTDYKIQLDFYTSFNQKK